MWIGYAAAAAKSLSSFPTLCDPIDSSPPGSPIPGILQVRTLEWVAISFSNAWKWKVKGKSLSRVQLLATSWTAAHQAPPSMGFSRQEYWSGVPLPSLESAIPTHIPPLSCVSSPQPCPASYSKALLSCPQSLPFCQFLHCRAGICILLLIQSLLAGQLSNILPGEKVNFPKFSLLLCVIWAP